MMFVNTLYFVKKEPTTEKGFCSNRESGQQSNLKNQKNHMQQRLLVLVLVPG